MLSVLLLNNLICDVNDYAWPANLRYEL